MLVLLFLIAQHLLLRILFKVVLLLRRILVIAQHLQLGFLLLKVSFILAQRICYSAAFATAQGTASICFKVQLYMKLLLLHKL